MVNADPVLFDALIYGRGLSVDFMQDRGIEINKRILLSLLIADIVQKHINKGTVSEAGTSLDKYTDIDFLKNIFNEFDRMSINIQHKSEYYCLIINTFIKIELSNKIFTKYINEVIEYVNKILNEGDLSAFDTLEKAYEAANKDKESIYENFLVYQLFHNYMKAYKTKDLKKEITMIIAMSSFIKLIFMIHWQKSGEKLNEKDIIEILYSYTRSIVHVKENTDIIMDAIRDKNFDSMANLYFLIK